MANKSIIILLILLLSKNLFAQFPPAAGVEGSTAIAADSSVISRWATQCTVEQGWIDISDTSLGKVTMGSDSMALYAADNQTISLGDGGWAVYTFDPAIANRNGYDFCIFENSFNDNFLELAFVEVSTNGIDYFRFNAVSLSPEDPQIGGFGTIDPTAIHNFAGKYRGGYGTPFDLGELPDDPNLDKNNIRFVRIIDVIGSVDPQYATYDSEGHKVNDPWPTPFPSGGFDLDALGIINTSEEAPYTSISPSVEIFPNPASQKIFVQSETAITGIILYTQDGRIISKYVNENRKPSAQIDIEELKPGFYLLSVQTKAGILTKRFVKTE